MKPEEIEAKDIHEWAVARMQGLKLPVPRKPKNTDPEFSLPDDPDALPSPEVGQLMMRFAASPLGSVFITLHPLVAGPSQARS